MIAGLAIVLAAVVVLHFSPLWSRPGMFFAVTVRPEFSATPEALDILSLYRAIVWSGAGLAIAVALATHRSAAFAITLLGWVAAVAMAQRRTQPYRVCTEASVEVDLAAPPESFPVGWLAALLPLEALGRLALWASDHWAQLPARLPVRWGIHGPNGWVERTPAKVYGMLCADAGLSLCLVLMAAGIVYWSRRVSATRALAAEEQRFRSINARAILLFAYVPPLQACAILMGPPMAGFWLAGSVLGACAVYYYFLVRDRPRGALRSGDHTPDSCWKLGLFYFNPSDPAMFVVRRVGLGYAANWGNRWSWAGLMPVLAVVAMRVIAG